jgi:hypothetical protein
VVEKNGEKREVYYFWLGLEVNERPAVHVLVILDTPINIVRRMVVIMRKVQGESGGRVCGPPCFVEKDGSTSIEQGQNKRLKGIDFKGKPEKWPIKAENPLFCKCLN